MAKEGWEGTSLVLESSNHPPMKGLKISDLLVLMILEKSKSRRLTGQGIT